MREIQAEVSVNKNILTFPHLHNKLELLFCLEGELEVTCGKHKKQLKTNDFALIMPYTVHSYQSAKHSKVLIITVLKENLPLFHKYFSIEPLYPYIENILDSDIDYITKKLTSPNRQNISFEQLIGYIYIILSYVFNAIEFSNEEKKGISDLLPNVLNYIEKNFHDEISLESIAFNIGVNSSYLSRIFSDKIGYSVTKYINEVRVDYAKSMLLSTDNSITDIAFNSGFKSIRTFNRVFLEHTNYTPKEYRTNKSKTIYDDTITTRHFKDAVTVSGMPANGKLTFYK